MLIAFSDCNKLLNNADVTSHTLHPQSEHTVTSVVPDGGQACPHLSFKSCVCIHSWTINPHYLGLQWVMCVEQSNLEPS